jgi:hypothetical protein
MREFNRLLTIEKSIEYLKQIVKNGNPKIIMVSNPIM